MSLDMNDPLDRLYLELIPHRITAPLGTEYGPTEQFRRLELDRELWQTLALFGDDDVEAGAA